MSDSMNPQDYAGEIGFDDPNIKAADASFYKGTKDQTDRIGIVSKGFKTLMTHYKKGLGHVICRSTPPKRDESGKIVESSQRALCCKKLKPAKLRCGGVIVQYRTDQHGNLKEPFTYDVKVWVFGEDKYVTLRNINSEFPISENDLKVHCTDPGYQKLQIQPANGSFWQKDKLGWKPEILAEAAALQEKLPTLMGKMRTDEEILENVGAVPDDQQVANVVGNDQDLDKVLENI